MLRAFFKGRQVDTMLAAQPMNRVYQVKRDPVQLVQWLIALSDTGHVALSTVGLELAWQR